MKKGEDEKDIEFVFGVIDGFNHNNETFFAKSGDYSPEKVRTKKGSGFATSRKSPFFTYENGTGTPFGEMEKNMEKSFHYTLKIPFHLLTGDDAAGMVVNEISVDSVENKVQEKEKIMNDFQANLERKKEKIIQDMENTSKEFKQTVTENYRILQKKIKIFKSLKTKEKNDNFVIMENGMTNFTILLQCCSDVMEIIFQFLSMKDLLLNVQVACSFFSTIVKRKVPLHIKIGKYFFEMENRLNGASNVIRTLSYYSNVRVLEVIYNYEIPEKIIEMIIESHSNTLREFIFPYFFDYSSEFCERWCRVFSALSKVKNLEKINFKNMEFSDSSNVRKKKKKKKKVKRKVAIQGGKGFSSFNNFEDSEDHDDTEKISALKILNEEISKKIKSVGFILKEENEEFILGFLALLERIKFLSLRRDDFHLSRGGGVKKKKRKSSVRTVNKETFEISNSVLKVLDILLKKEKIVDDLTIPVFPVEWTIMKNFGKEHVNFLLKVKKLSLHLNNYVPEINGGLLHQIVLKENLDEKKIKNGEFYSLLEKIQNSNNNFEIKLKNPQYEVKGKEIAPFFEKSLSLKSKKVILCFNGNEKNRSILRRMKRNGFIFSYPLCETLDFSKITVEKIEFETNSIIILNISSSDMNIFKGMILKSNIKQYKLSLRLDTSDNLKSLLKTFIVMLFVAPKVERFELVFSFKNFFYYDYDSSSDSEDDEFQKKKNSPKYEIDEYSILLIKTLISLNKPNFKSLKIRVEEEKKTKNGVKGMKKKTSNEIKINSPDFLKILFKDESEEVKKDFLECLKSNEYIEELEIQGIQWQKEINEMLIDRKNFDK